MEQHPVLQPYELLAERHLAMDMERYLQVQSRAGDSPVLEGPDKEEP